MLFKKPKSELEELLAETLPTELHTGVYRVFMPHSVAQAWLSDSGLKFTAADVIALAAQIAVSLPKPRNP